MADGAHHFEDRGADGGKDVERPGQQEGRPVGRSKGRHLGDLLAENGVNERDEEQRQHRGDGMLADNFPVFRKPLEERLNELGDGRLADRADGDAGKGDSELCRGDASIEVPRGGLDRFRAADSVLDHLLDVRFPHGHQRILDGNEEGIDEYEHRNRQQPEDVHYFPLLGH